MKRDRSTKDGLCEKDREIIREVFGRYPEVHAVTLFGSRATGDFRRGSDVDLAIEGEDVSLRTLARIAGDFEDSLLPFKVDLVLRDESISPDLDEHILKHGKLLDLSLHASGVE